MHFFESDVIQFLYFLFLELEKLDSVLHLNKFALRFLLYHLLLMHFNSIWVKQMLVF